MGISDPQQSAERCHSTSKASRGELVASLLGGSDLNYVGCRSCVRRDNVGAWKERGWGDTVELGRRKDELGGQERNRIHRVTRNGAWLAASMERNYLGGIPGQSLL